MRISKQQTRGLWATIGALGVYALDPLLTIVRLNVEVWAHDNGYDKYLVSPKLGNFAMTVLDMAYTGWEFLSGEFALGFAAAALILTFWDPVARYSRHFREKPIPIAISEIKSQWFSNYAGFYEDSAPQDDQAWSFGDVQIANISDTKNVSLKIYLCINEKEGEPRFNLKLLADGLGTRWGLKYQEQKVIHKGGPTWDIVPTGRPVPNIIRCPLNLKPHDPSIEAKLVFITGLGSMGREQITLGAANNKFVYSLLIEDHISGNKVSFPIPGSYRGK